MMPAMPFLDALGRTWDIADLAAVPFPTSTGGNTRGCPLDAVTRPLNAPGAGGPPEPDVVVAALRARRPEVAACWHHRLGAEHVRYIADLTRWFVEQELTAFEDVVRAVVRRDGGSDDHVHAMMHLFDDPLRWSFVPGEALTNGRHRLCALKAAGANRVAMRTLDPPRSPM